MSDQDHPGALDIVCDGWDGPPVAGDQIGTIAALAAALDPYPDRMHVRVSVPVVHDSMSHRMLDVVMLGHSVGTGAGAGVQLITESWDFPHMVIKELPHVTAARQAEYEKLAASVPPGEALP